MYLNGLSPHCCDGCVCILRAPFDNGDKSRFHSSTGVHFFSIRSTAANSESGPFPSMASDFSKKLLAPSFSNCFAFFCERLVNIITGIAAVAGSCFKAFSTSGPLILGSITSSRIKPGTCSRARRKAWSPSPAEITSYPAGQRPFCRHSEEPAVFHQKYFHDCRFAFPRLFTKYAPVEQTSAGLRLVGKSRLHSRRSKSEIA